MNKFVFAVALASLLVGGCNKPASTPAPEAPAASASDGEAVSAPVSTAPETSIASAELVDKTVNDAIDTLLGDHTKYQAVINAYQKAVTAGDKEAVAALIDYPFTATLDGKRISIKNAAGFVENYDKIITPAIAGVIKTQKYSDLMVNGKGVMFGSGETWINGICKKGSADCSEFEVKVVTIQPGAS